MWLRVTLILVVSGLATSCSDDPAKPPPPSELQLTFDSELLTAAANEGTESVTITTATGGGGAVEPGEGPDGTDAAKFPSFGTAELAALKVLAAGDDFLSPGDADFEFGVDFVLDEESEGDADNGNNLIQRGLFDESSQYKLQIDHGRVSCRLQGSAGEAVVVSDKQVAPGDWYRARCTRDGDTVTLTVGDIDDSGEMSELAESETEAATGAIDFAPTSPLSVGAKVSPEGDVVPSSPDQFNGTLDNVVYSRLS